jgi:glycolate oxidase
MKDIYSLCKSYGGAVSGEHGIGIDKKDFFSMTMEQSQLDAMRKIKEAFDPHCILNPGKIFD